MKTLHYDVNVLRRINHWTKVLIDKEASFKQWNRVLTIASRTDRPNTHTDYRHLRFYFDRHTKEYKELEKAFKLRSAGLYGSLGKESE